MPGGDRTGPIGQGPMTGRGRGYCAGFGLPGYQSPAPGRGLGRVFGRGMGRGRGRGWGRGWCWPADYGWGQAHPPVAAESEVIRQEIAVLENHIAALNQRLADLNPNRPDDGE